MVEKNRNLCYYLEKLACLGVGLHENTPRRVEPRPPRYSAFISGFCLGWVVTVNQGAGPYQVLLLKQLLWSFILVPSLTVVTQFISVSI